MEKVLVYGMTNNPGGIESYLIRNLLDTQHNHICFDFVTDFSEIAYESYIRENGSEIYFIPAKGKSLIAHWRALWKLMKQHPEYKKIYFNILDAGAVFTMFIPWILGREIITHSHNGATEKVRLHAWCKPLLCIITKKYLACSNLAADFMFGEKIVRSGKVRIIPNAINAKKFDYNTTVRKIKRKEMGLEDCFTICFVGRLTYQKNPLGLIDIFESVSKSEHTAILLIVGTGDMEEQVKERVRNKNLEKKVRFLGIRNDISEIMQASDVFLLPSIYEGLPIVGIEAQASGLPCVLSNSITREVDVTGNVFFVSLQDPVLEWKSRILDLRKFERKSTRLEIQKHGYDLETSKENIKKVIEEIFE